MSLLETFAKRKQTLLVEEKEPSKTGGSNPLIAIKHSKKIEEIEETKETEDSEGEDFDLDYVGDKYPTPDPTLFLASITPLLLYPYTIEITVGRDYKRWLLSPSLYVLNSFNPVCTNKIFLIYMKKNPPKQPFDLYKLWMLLTELELYVPIEYQERIEELLETKLLEQSY